METVPGESVSVRGLVMLRDLLTPEAAVKAELEQERLDAGRGTSQGVMTPLRSQGRAVLAVNAGLFGAFTAFSLQSAAGGRRKATRAYSIPLLALGTGIGIGAALLVADEWDVTTGDAWFSRGGRRMGRGVGLPLAAGHDVQPLTDRYSWGVGGGFIGLGLATVALTRTTMDDGDATLTHSGGALGLLAGGAIDWLGRGTTTVTPYYGMGYGTAIGLVGAGVLATQVTGFAVPRVAHRPGRRRRCAHRRRRGEPAHLHEQQRFPEPQWDRDGKTRGWLSATLGGAVLGGGLAWWLTRDPAKDSRVAAAGRPLRGHHRLDSHTRGRGADLRRCVVRWPLNPEFSRQSAPGPACFQSERESAPGRVRCHRHLHRLRRRRDRAGSTERRRRPPRRRCPHRRNEHRELVLVEQRRRRPEAGSDAIVTNDGTTNDVVTIEASPVDGCKATGPEKCTNGVDDDCNGLTDCADPACQTQGYACAAPAPGGWDFVAFDATRRPAARPGSRKRTSTSTPRTSPLRPRAAARATRRACRASTVTSR